MIFCPVVLATRKFHINEQVHCISVSLILRLLQTLAKLIMESWKLVVITDGGEIMIQGFVVNYVMWFKREMLLRGNLEFAKIIHNEKLRR